MLLLRCFCLPVLFFCAAAQGEVHWRNCGTAPLADPSAEKVPVQCARITVPMAYDHHGNGRHDQRTVRLALHRVPASGERLGTLLLISGGPGEPSILRYLPTDRLPAKVREHFDIVAYDPRGIGASSPRIRCNHDPGIDSETFVKSCMAQTNPAFLPHIGTFEAAHDVEYIRRALGEEKLNIIGYSYGSKVAMRYALHHPEGVRAMVLDGIINVHLPLYHQQVRQQRGFQQAAERFLAVCRKDADCPFAHAQADANMLYPLMRKRALLEKADMQKKADNPLLGLLEIGGLRARPIPTDFELTHVFYLGLLQGEHWPSLSKAMADFMTGQHHTFRERFGALMGDYAHFGILAALICADTAGYADSGSAVILQRHLDLLSPWDNHHLPYRPPEASPCVYWPYIGSDYRHPLPPLPDTLPQILTVSHEHDPTTPWQNAREMADWLRAPLLTVEGDGHIAAMVGRSSCVDGIIRDYLRHPEKPLQDMRCAADNSRWLVHALWLLAAVCALWWLWRRKRRRQHIANP